MSIDAPWGWITSDDGRVRVDLASETTAKASTVLAMMASGVGHPVTYGMYHTPMAFTGPCPPIYCRVVMAEDDTVHILASHDPDDIPVPEREPPLDFGRTLDF